MNRELLEKPFASEQIKQREGNFGKTLDYIEGHSVIQRLNDSFEAEWSFEIQEYKILENEVNVLGKLIVGDVVKMQFGSSKITKTKETGNIISLADDLKAATTDALKKAATLFGVGLHLYGSSTTGQKDAGGNGNGKKDNFTSSENNNPSQAQNGSNGGGRLSAKQYNYIMKLCNQSGRKKPALDDYCVNAYGTVAQHLSKTDASGLINQLLAEYN